MPDFRLLFESSPSLYMVLAPEPGFPLVAVSDAYLRATMTRRSEVLGRKLFEIFPDNPDDPHASGVRNLAASLERVMKQRVPDAMAVQKYDIRRPAEEGGGFEERWWSPVNSPIFSDDGELRYILHRAEDITDFVRLKQQRLAQETLTAELSGKAQLAEMEIYLRGQQIQEKNRELERANEEITRLYEKTRELDELKTQFFAAVSHELRTPLALILGPTERLLAQEKIAEPVKRELDVIGRNARMLLRHVNDLLDLSKLDAGQVQIRYTDTDVASLVRFIAGNFESFASERSVTFSVESPESLPAQVDPDKVRRILLNLLANAFKFTPTGGRIRSTVRANETHLFLEVADSGPGIPADKREAVFERFRQLEGGTARQFGGTGLGLAIVRDFVALHGGAVRIGDAPEGGAAFVVELPRYAPPETPLHVDPDVAMRSGEYIEILGTVDALRMLQPAAASPVQASSGPLVLVVEDNPDMSRFIVEALAAAPEQYRVVSAGDGKDGLDKALALRPELILSDVMMPKMSGDEFVRALRRIPELGDTPILLLSAKADEALRIRMLEEGAQDYITKPFSVQELLARVQSQIRRSRAGARVQQLSDELKDVAAASLAVSESAAGLPEKRLDAVLHAIAQQAQILTAAQYAAVGIGTDPSLPFSSWSFVGMDGKQAEGIGSRPHPVGVLGMVAIENRVVRIRDLRKNPAFSGARPHLPHMASFLGVPIRFRGRSVGNIYLVNKQEAEEFSEHDQRIVEMLAARTGAIIETAQRYESEGLERAWLNAVIDQLPEAIALRDATGRVVAQNRAFVELWCQPTEASDAFGVKLLLDLRRPSGERLRPDEYPSVRALLHKETVTSGELQVRKADGSLVPVIAAAAPVLQRDGTVAGAALILRDISSMKDMERMREEWAAMIAHELQQPVHAINLRLQLLARRTLGERERRDLGHISDATMQMSRLARDLLDASKLESHRLELRPTRLELGALLGEVLERLPEIAQRTELRRPEGEALYAMADSGRVEQVLSNLLHNAVKYGEEGTPIGVRLQRSGSHAEFVITNRGRGIPAEELPHLFERFHRTQEARQSVTPGSGLGLYVARGLIEAHGGRIWAESSPGETTAFHFTLPLLTAP